jgi:hypothetical protein
MTPDHQDITNGYRLDDRLLKEEPTSSGIFIQMRTSAVAAVGFTKLGRHSRQLKHPL